MTVWDGLAEVLSIAMLAAAGTVSAGIHALRRHHVI